MSNAAKWHREQAQRWVDRAADDVPASVVGWTAEGYAAYRARHDERVARKKARLKLRPKDMAAHHALAAKVLDALAVVGPELFAGILSLPRGLTPNQRAALAILRDAAKGTP